MQSTHRRVATLSLIVLVTIALDQATKAIASAVLPPYTISLLGDIVRLYLSENVGAFLGLGSTLSPELRFWLLIVASAGLLVGVALWLVLTPGLHRDVFVALSCVAGGGLSNLVDRVLREGRVVDFLNVGIGRVRTGVFNVADIAITFGAIYVVWAGLRRDISGDTGADPQQ